jgi:hypothetical protein
LQGVTALGVIGGAVLVPALLWIDSASTAALLLMLGVYASAIALDVLLRSLIVGFALLVTVGMVALWGARRNMAK